MGIEERIRSFFRLSEGHYSILVDAMHDNSMTGHFKMLMDSVRDLLRACRASLDRRGAVPPKSPLNPTKNTPSQIAVLDQGEATVFSEEDGKFIKLRLKGRKLNGPFYAAQQEGSKLWIFQQSELPESVRS
jgi:hypothetical protein